ncbi:FAD-linked oxidoreductase-like protein, partial [Blyttiomyces helicus]
RSTPDLLNSLLVFQMCAIPFLVDMTPTLIDAAGKVGMKRPLYAIVKATFFKHFCGGEDLKEVLPTMETFKKARVGSILDLALEADLDAGSLTGAAAHEHARKVAGQFRDSIDIAAENPGSFIAVKITALIPPAILQRWSNSIVLLQDAIYSPPAVRLLLRAPIEPVAEDNALITEDDISTTALVTPEIDSVAAHARARKVRIMVDAEQTYFQPAIDDVAAALAIRFNPPFAPKGTRTPPPTIYNTYQMYLKDSTERLALDTDRAARSGNRFGVKIVRGAYMESERERAEELGIPSPIHDTREDTHAAYNAAIEFLAGRLAAGERPLAFVVASH